MRTLDIHNYFCRGCGLEIGEEQACSFCWSEAMRKAPGRSVRLGDALDRPRRVSIALMAAAAVGALLLALWS